MRALLVVAAIVLVASLVLLRSFDPVAARADPSPVVAAREREPVVVRQAPPAVAVEPPSVEEEVADELVEEEATDESVDGVGEKDVWVYGCDPDREGVQCGWFLRADPPPDEAAEVDEVDDEEEATDEIMDDADENDGLSVVRGFDGHQTGWFLSKDDDEDISEMRLLRSSEIEAYEAMKDAVFYRRGMSTRE